jgi:hypothetical protein
LLTGEDKLTQYAVSGEARKEQRVTIGLGSLGAVAAMIAMLTGPAVAEGLPDILGIQLGMPARDAHAKLQAALPKNKIQVMSENLPTSTNRS